MLLSTSVFADFVTLSETLKDNTVNGIYSSTTDSGTFNVSLTVSNLSKLTASAWSNLTCVVQSPNASLTPINVKNPSAGPMSSATNYGGTVTATSATFYYQEPDTNNVETNVYKITFSRSGNVFTISAQTTNPPSLLFPYSFLASAYYDRTGASSFAIKDQSSCEVTLLDNSLTISNGEFDVVKAIYITGTNAIAQDANGTELNNISVTGVANFTPPAITAVSPASSMATTNGLLTVQVRATNSIGVSNVEFYVGGADYGAGIAGVSNLWSMSFALRPGTNIIQTVATDFSGYNSPTNTLVITYINKQTNAPQATFSERWLDTFQTNNPGNGVSNTITQDVGVLNTAVSVPGLAAMTANTWSALLLSVSFGNLVFSGSLASANILTSNSATFYLDQKTDTNGNPIIYEQLTVSRSGNTLVLTAQTGNSTYYPAIDYFIADKYIGAGNVQDTEPFALTLTDGNTAANYVSISQPMFITGTDVITFDPYLQQLDNIQISGHVDFIPPTNQITSPVAGQIATNADFTIIGMASDNVRVANVFYSVNTTGWNVAYTAYDFTNWFAPVTLILGTNIISAYAVDTSGNTSATDTVAVVYELLAPVTINVGTGGTVNSNYNGALLQIGKTYSVTAKANPGFVFSGWTGSIMTNSPTLTFLMASNLVFNATFADVQPPTNQITAPTAGQRWSNSVFVVTGKARDNLAVANVFYSLNGGGWNSAMTANSWSNWTAQVTLIPGTNTIQAYAVDTSGNVSKTNSVNFVYIFSTVLTVGTSGTGTFTPPNYNGASLQVGKVYSLTAKPGAGFAFFNWTGGTNLPLIVLTNKPVLLFTMQPNLMLQANFVYSNPPSITITAPAGVQRVSNVVYTVMGKASDKVGVTGVFYSLNGATYASASTATGWSNWTATVNLALGTNNIQVYAVNASNVVSQVKNAVVILVPATMVFPISTADNIKHPQAKLAFDGTNYLVVFQTYPSGQTNGSAVGQFVSSSGDLVGTELALNPNGADDPPSVAFDGADYVVAWADHSDMQAGVPVSGVFVSPDGLLASVGQISQSTNVDSFGTVVYGAGVYFLMWSDASTSPDSLYGAMLTPAGGVVASDFLISANAQADDSVQSAAAFDGANFLAVWSSATGNTTINGQLINPAGNLVGSPFVIYSSATPAGMANPCVIFDGTQYVVLFNIGVNTNNAKAFHVLGRFVTPAGEVLTNNIALTGDTGPQTLAGAAFDGQNYLVTWNQGLNPFSTAASTKVTINGRFLNTQGLPAASEFPIFSTKGNQIPTRAPVLFDGTQFVLVTGLGRFIKPTPDMLFTNGVISGAFIVP